MSWAGMEQMRGVRISSASRAAVSYKGQGRWAEGLSSALRCYAFEQAGASSRSPLCSELQHCFARTAIIRTTAQTLKHAAQSNRCPRASDGSGRTAVSSTAVSSALARTAFTGQVLEWSGHWSSSARAAKVDQERNRGFHEQARKHDNSSRRIN